MAGIPLDEVGSAIAYKCPPTSDDVVCIKRASYQKGEFPEHLRQYAGQVAGAAQACRGKKGSSFTACLRNEAR